ncbi:YhgE/Pip family protein [Lacisediminihabitans sp.]|uniref:YhgE/Pip family protein n=1 Tax=Lacisediminihabitans sp. TaxID=2787631 RepID=UPI00374D6DC6
MTIPTLVRAEFARLTASRIGIAALVALMTVPLVYGGLYLWGNQDPYSNLDKVPAALVVQDTGTTVDGTPTNYGRKAATSLLDGKKFGWVEVSSAQAATGVKDGTYDFGLTFPADFSTRLASSSGDEPVSAALKLTTDDTNSYLSTTIAKQAAEAVRVEIAKQVGSEASITLLNAVGSIRDGLVKADDGAVSLASGAATAAAGASSLASGSATLSTGAAKLSTGLHQLDAKTAALPSSAAQLSAGASSLAGKLSTASSTAGTLASNTSAAQTAYAKLVADAQVPGAVLDPRVLADIQALGTPVGTANAYAGGLAAPTGLPAAAAGAAQVAAGASTLSASAPALASAVHSAAGGAASLATGAASASTGASDLSTGVGQLATGSKTLSDSLTDAVGKIPQTTAAERAATSNLIANPVQVNQDAITQAKNYGAGLAPFFLSLASWIGIYALFLLVRPLSRRALTAVRRPIRTTLAGWLTPALLGVVQMVALFALVTLALHLPVANPVGMVAFMAFVAMTFAAIVLALNVLLGSVGQFLALVFMVVQLVTAGGTFPWQTLPAPLAALHQALPMSHAVDGIRQLMYGGTGGDLWSAFLPLAAWFVGSLALSVLGARKQGRFRTLRQLRPSPIGA